MKNGCVQLQEYAAYKVSIKTVKCVIECICWFSVVTILVWHAVLYRVNAISNIALLVLFTNNLYGQGRRLRIEMIVTISTITLLAIYSMLMGNAVGTILRFALIVFFICNAYWVRICKPRLAINILVSITAIFSLVIVVIEGVLLLLRVDITPYRLILIERGIGDVYIKYRFLYAIQLVGTSVIPFVYMLMVATSIYPKRVLFFLRVLFLMASLCAGNFMYIIAIVSYHLIDLLVSSKSKLYLRRHIWVWLCIIMILPTFYKFIHNTLEEKKELSNVVRVEQVRILIKDLAESPSTLFFGKGLGNTVRASGSFVDYGDEDVYFEVQSIYFLNQLGIIPFLLFIIFNIVYTMKYIKTKRVRLVYLGYVIFGISNPYILNTQHVVVIISLICVEMMVRPQIPKRINLITN